MNKLPSIKNHDVMCISARDFFAILRFEKRHPELFYHSRQRTGLMFIQTQVFNQLFYGPYADEFKDLINNPDDD